MTLAYRDQDPMLAGVAGALRDLLAAHDIAQAVAVPARDLPPRCSRRCEESFDLHATTILWSPGEGAPALASALAWLGDGASARAFARAGLADEARAWTRFSSAARVIPLLHSRRAVRHDPALIALRFAPWGGLVVEDAWRREVGP